MIISHQYKFIFVKTMKTAGTSIEIALSKYCGKDDIITPISLEDEAIREELGYRGPQNYLSTIGDYRVKDLGRLLIKGKKKQKFYNHISAKEIKKYIAQETWDEYYKFCFVRNPWDRMISQYYWRCRSEPRPTLSEFIKSKTAFDIKEKGIDLYTIDGQVVVNKLCYFENIVDDLMAIQKVLNLPGNIELPRAKSGYRKDKRNYKEIIDDGLKGEIAELFQEEIELLGYEF